jgi:hypothetical protein
VRHIQLSEPLAGIAPAAPTATPVLNWRGEFETAMELYESTTASDRARADEIIKKLIVHAGSNVTPASPLNKIVPTVGDINLRWVSDEFTAVADPKRIDDAYTSDWDWFEFRKNIVVPNGPAYTESVIAHELDHAAYAKNLYDQWNAGGSTGGSWDDY